VPGVGHLGRRLDLDRLLDRQVVHRLVEADRDRLIHGYGADRRHLDLAGPEPVAAVGDEHEAEQEDGSRRQADGHAGPAEEASEEGRAPLRLVAFVGRLHEAAPKSGPEVGIEGR